MNEAVARASERPFGREERRARESRAERDRRSLMQPARNAGDAASDEAGEA